MGARTYHTSALVRTLFDLEHSVQVNSIGLWWAFNSNIEKAFNIKNVMRVGSAMFGNKAHLMLFKAVIAIKIATKELKTR